MYVHQYNQLYSLHGNQVCNRMYSPLPSRLYSLHVSQLCSRQHNQPSSQLYSLHANRVLSHLFILLPSQQYYPAVFHRENRRVSLLFNRVGSRLHTLAFCHQISLQLAQRVNQLHCRLVSLRSGR